MTEPVTSDSLLPVKCPHCEESFSVGMAATIPAEQKLTMTLEHTSPFIAATTLGETISNMSKLLGAVADEIGGKVAVMVESCVLEQGKATINFVITSVKP